MSDFIFPVVDRDGELVVDSRLVAERLGIEVHAFHQTIRKYETQTQQEFGCTAFETAGIKMPNGGTRSEILHYWLNENQANFLMTLSRNTPQVVEAKLQLVKAFGQAKDLLMQAMRDRVATLEGQSKANRHLRKARTAMNAAHKESPVAVLDWMRVMNADFGISSTADRPDLAEVDKLSLAANRMGLSFNKHLKTLDSLNAAFDPKVINQLRSSHQEAMLTIGRLEIELAEARISKASEDLLGRELRSERNRNEDLSSQVAHLEKLLEIEEKRTKVADRSWDVTIDPDPFKNFGNAFPALPARKGSQSAKKKTAPKLPSKPSPLALSPAVEAIWDDFSVEIAKEYPMSVERCQEIAEAILALNPNPNGTMMERQARSLLQKYAERGEFSEQEVLNLGTIFGGKFSARLKAALKTLGLKI